MSDTHASCDHGPPTQGEFRTTHWSEVLAAGEAASARAHEALGKLCQTYWFPLYAFVRRSGHDKQDAQDLTQEFLARLIAREGLAAVRPTKGRFRSFLLVSLKNFLADDRDRAQAQKRGGGRPMVSLDDSSAETLYQLEAKNELAPDRIFERRWACALLENVMTRLAEEQAAAGKGDLFNSLRPFLAGEADGLAYADVARSLNLSEEAARMTVSRLRRRYRQLLRREVANTVADPAEIDAELRDLLTAVQ